MTTTRSRLRTRFSAVVAGALAAGGLVALAPAAHAEQTGEPVDATAQWAISGLSQRYYNGFANLKLDELDDVTCSDANAAATQGQVICSSLGWAGGTVTIAGGETTIEVEGSTTLWATTGNQWITLADLNATFDATGAGEVTAVVSFGTTTGGDWTTKAPKAAGTGTRVTIVDLDPASTGDAYPFGSVAYSDSVTDGVRTWSGLKGLWAPEFLTYLYGPDEVPDSQAPGGSSDGYVYHTAFQNQVDTSDRVRYPSPFTFSADLAVATTTAAVTESVPGSLKVEVDGNGFRKADPGIYVSLGEEGSFSPTDASVFVKTNWVQSSGINADGTFSSTLALTAPDIEKLDPTKSYVVYTQKAHGESVGDPSQNSETPVTIDFASLKELTTVSAPAVTVTSPAAAVVKATVTGAEGGTPAGTVKVLDGATELGSGTLTDGTATITLSGLPVGSKQYAIQYSGDSDFWKSAGTVSVTVQAAVPQKAATTVKTKVTKKVTLKKAGKVKVTVGSGVSKPSGKVTITLKKGKKTKTIKGTVKNGVVVVKIKKNVAKKLGKGKWKVTVAYQGDATHAPSTTTFKLKVKKK